MSDPREIRIYRKDDAIKAVFTKEVLPHDETAEGWLWSLAGRMKDIIARHESRIAISLFEENVVPERRDPLQQIEYLARSYLSCEVLFGSI